MNQLVASIFVFFGSASYGMLSTATKLAYLQGFTTPQVVGSQMFVGCLGFWLSSYSYWRQTVTMPVKTIAALMLTGAMSGLTGIFYYLSLKTLPASYAVILLFQFTWLGMALDYIHHLHKPTSLQKVAASMILFGTILAVGIDTNTNASGITAEGIALGLMAAASYTAFMHLSGLVASGTPTIVRNNWMVLGAVATAFIVFPPYFLIDGALSAGLWQYGGFLGLFGIILPFYFFAKGIPYIGTGRAALLGAVELPVVILFSVWLLQEQLAIVQLAGIMIILAGILLSAIKK